MTEKITKDIKIGDFVKDYPEAAPIMLSYGLLNDTDYNHILRVIGSLLFGLGGKPHECGYRTPLFFHARSRVV